MKNVIPICLHCCSLLQINLKYVRASEHPRLCTFITGKSYESFLPILTALMYDNYISYTFLMAFIQYKTALQNKPACVQYVRTFRGINADSDRMLVIKLKQKISKHIDDKKSERRMLSKK